MLYTGIDLHKFTSYLTTVDSNGCIVKQADIKNVDHNFVQYFSELKDDNKAVVESTMTWYWLNDLLTSMNIPLILAHAKFVKAIAYAKVKTDKVDSHTLAQLLRLDYIPSAHKISNDLRSLRDALRARLKIVQRHTSITNSMHLLLAKYNLDSPDELSGIPKYQYDQLSEVEILLKEQALNLEKQLYPNLIPNEDIQRLLWIPGIGKMNAFSILLEVDDINRFADVKNFFSYCRLSPSARNSGGRTKQRSSKDGNKYLRVVFADAATRAVQHYPVIKNFYNSKLRKKNRLVAKTILAKELARIVFFVLKDKTNFNNTFKGIELQHKKYLQWPRVTNPYA
ncbi:MAG: IS110 family transposase [Melioribacteraceae bacterium]|nr:MAG: IS110 family transposase [Melioribacteraceae bacterium]